MGPPGRAYAGGMSSESPRRFAASDVTIAPFAQLSPEDLYGLLQLRSEVFVVEQECLFLDLDGVDLYPETLHAILPASVLGRTGPVPFRDSHGEQTGLSLKPAGYARLLPRGLIDGPAGHPEDRSIGRVVADPEVRAGGIGSALVGALVEQFGPETMLTLNGQAHLRGFYEKFGFAVSGDEFLEDGIPHLPMRRPAGPAV